MTEPDVSSAPMNSPFEVLAIDAPVFFPNWANSENSTDSGVLDIEAPLDSSPTYLLSVDVNTFGLACIIEIDLDSDNTFAPTSFPDSMNVRPETSANTFCVDLIVVPEVPRAIPKT